ncbi:MAG: hypothetical protein AB7I19_09690 [Planctomycetota bacterium]
MVHNERTTDDDGRASVAWFVLAGSALALAGLTFGGFSWVSWVLAEAGSGRLYASAPISSGNLNAREAQQVQVSQEKSRHGSITMAGPIERTRPSRLEPSIQFADFQSVQTTRLFYTTQHSFVGESIEIEVVGVLDAGAAEAMQLHSRRDLREGQRAELAALPEALRDRGSIGQSSRSLLPRRNPTPVRGQRVDRLSREVRS